MRVSSNNPRNTCGTHLGSSCPLVSKVANYTGRQIVEFKRKNNNIIMKFIGCAWPI